MKLLFIRHGDPDYGHDTLTAQGWKEAELLAERLSTLEVKDFYVSPLGRAKDTASLTLKKMHRQAEEKQWLREFYSPVQKPYPSPVISQCWDWLPEEYMKYPDLRDYHKWLEVPCMKEAGIKEEYERVCDELDKLLAEHGYVYNSRYYEVKEPNHDRLVFFCHYGVTIVFISHFLQVSPMTLWQNIMSAPTGVTEFVSEEREKGKAIFRMLSYGDVSHLYGHASPSFAGRFCECYDDDTRHE